MKGRSLLKNFQMDKQSYNAGSKCTQKLTHDSGIWGHQWSGEQVQFFGLG